MNALTAIGAHKPDIVFLDIGMPDLDGYRRVAGFECPPAEAGDARTHENTLKQLLGLAVPWDRHYL
jgi:hypothetical protein